MPHHSHRGYPSPLQYLLPEHIEEDIINRTFVHEIRAVIRDDKYHRLVPSIFNKRKDLRITQATLKGLIESYLENLVQDATFPDNEETDLMLGSFIIRSIRRRLDGLTIECTKEIGLYETLNERLVVWRYSKAFKFLRRSIYSRDIGQHYARGYFSQFGDPTPIQYFLTSGDPWRSLKGQLRPRRRNIQARMSLSDFVSIIWSKFRLMPMEWLSKFGKTPMSPDIVRLDWICRCGHRGFDHYQELEKHGTQELVASLRRQSITVHVQQGVTTRSPISQFINFVANLLRPLTRLFKRRRLPFHSSNDIALGGYRRPENQMIDNTRWLLFCSDSNTPRRVPTLEHIDMSTTKSDQQLFKILGQRYQGRKKKWSRFTRKLKAIRFVEVRPFLAIQTGKVL